MQPCWVEFFLLVISLSFVEYGTELNSVADPDPGSGIGCFFDPWIRDGKKSDPGSGINIPDPPYWN